MTKKYKINITQEEKGLGYSAKKALAAQKGLAHSPIEDISLERSDASQSSMIIEVKDSFLEKSVWDLVSNILSKSGQIPKNAKFAIDSITGLGGAAPAGGSSSDKSAKLYNEINILKSKLTAKENELTSAKNELILNQRRLEESQYASDIEDPVLGILSYFATKDFSFGSIIEKELDSAFAMRVLRDEIEDNLPAYIRHMDATDKSDKKINEILEMDINSLEQKKHKVGEEVDQLREEKVALERIVSGELDLPESFKTAIIKASEDKDYDAEIIDRQKIQTELDDVKKTKARYEKHKRNYSDLTEQIDLIKETSESMPLLFNKEENKLSIFLPIPARKSSQGLSDDLQESIGGVVKDNTLTARYSSKVARIPHDRFVAFSVELDTEEDTTEVFRNMVDSISDNVPLPLKLAGYTNFIPYRIGV